MRKFLLSPTGFVLTGFLVIGGYFLWAEHQVHVVTALPWLLIGGCLVMHLFMHGSHGGHGGGHTDGRANSRDSGGSDDAKAVDHEGEER
ncbi:DUF2933 domain-containing protein [Limibacillus sp. MBR-115]|jgi:hypothetical protein|uniref:DUF2933 domain-containing protein n=1 Tax=Limibacillus sp. MBR-115 TaxID=3156465 RepID=UPI0033910D80